MAKTYVEQIQKTQLLLSGLKNNIGLLADKGIDEDFIKKLEFDNSLSIEYNDEYDKLKADFKNKTIQANRNLLEVKRQVKEAKKIIKRSFDKTEWKNFGVNDKR